MKAYKPYPIILIILCILASCSSKKDYLYVNDMIPGVEYPMAMRHQAVVQRDDRLRITVSCRQPELAIPFNPVRSNGSGDGAEADGSYRVDVDGSIDFPVLGRLKVEGLTLHEVAGYIRDLLIGNNYIKEPIVNVDFVNFRYTVLGAVSSNGTYSAGGDRVTILEAIAKAGDLTPQANLDEIMVIREEGDKRRAYQLDIRKSDIFDSPCYYLQQNDIVYVRPNTKKGDSNNTDKTLRWLTVILSVVTAGCSLTWAIRR